ncbi:ABC transporter substrate-binding protein [Crocosphaera sp. Alani8]|uniref:ABC transporter substrate-binding protein n=1 Tax=Crocosphaera sp. Alani8 TaxID=3038952 RepID=UPI00313B9CE0
MRNSPVTLTTLLIAEEVAEWQPFVAEFERTHPHIRINLVEGPNATDQIEDLYTSSFLLGNAPYDLVFMDIIWVPKFAAAGWLLDLSERIPEAELSTFLEGDIEGGRYQGKLYRMPLRSDAGMLYYRSDWLEQIGAEPPETFDELLQISKTIQNKGLSKWGYLWQGKQYEGLVAMFVEILHGYGAFWINPETLEVGLDQPEALQAVNFLGQTISEGISPSGVTTYDEEITRRLFQNGEAVLLRNWPYVFRLASEPDSPIKGKFWIKPMVHAPGKSSGACQGGWGLGIAKSSSHLESALEFIKFFTSEEIQRQYVLATGYVPSRRGLLNDPTIVTKYPYYPQLLEVLENTVLRPPIAQYSEASDILQRYLSAALTGTMSPENAMKQATRETQELLKL